MQEIQTFNASFEITPREVFELGTTKFISQNLDPWG